MTLSIIITSQNRPKELERFVNSVNQQQDFRLEDLQIVFVDQGNNKVIFDLLDNRINKVYLQTQRCGLSKARNIALPYVKSEFIAFGDDDAWYDSTTFASIEHILHKTSIDGVGCCIKNDKNVPYNTYPSKITKLTYLNHCGVSSASMFLRFDPSIKFDEDIGVGSKYDLMSGEETDYLWTFMEYHRNFNIEFHPEIVVRHPVNAKQNFENHIEKSYKYARGFGYILKKHPLPTYYILLQFIRPALSLVLHAFSKQRRMKSFYLLKGRLEGYNYKINTNE